MKITHSTGIEDRIIQNQNPGKAQKSCFFVIFRNFWKKTRKSRKMTQKRVSDLAIFWLFWFRLFKKWKYRRHLATFKNARILPNGGIYIYKYAISAAVFWWFSPLGGGVKNGHFEVPWTSKWPKSSILTQNHDFGGHFLQKWRKSEIFTPKSWFWGSFSSKMTKIGDFHTKIMIFVIIFLENDENRRFSPQNHDFGGHFLQKWRKSEIFTPKSWFWGSFSSKMTKIGDFHTKIVIFVIIFLENDENRRFSPQNHDFGGHFLQKWRKSEIFTRKSWFSWSFSLKMMKIGDFHPKIMILGVIFFKNDENRRFSHENRDFRDHFPWKWWKSEIFTPKSWFWGSFSSKMTKIGDFHTKIMIFVIIFLENDENRRFSPQNHDFGGHFLQKWWKSEIFHHFSLKNGNFLRKFSKIIDFWSFFRWKNEWFSEKIFEKT